MKPRRRALITGGSGQDAYYLRQLLLDESYEVHIQSRAAANPAAAAENVVWHNLALHEAQAVERLVAEVRPAEIYNFAAISRPEVSWEQPLDVASINALVPLRFLHFIHSKRVDCRFYQASSSEVFGNVGGGYQNESTPLQPHNPYGVAKAYAHSMVGAFRRTKGLFACSGILFNHESPRRPLSYVSQKIAYAAGVIGSGAATSEEHDDAGAPIVCDGRVSLGSLDVHRDFGFAGDHMRAVWLMLQQAIPDDYVIGTGETHSVREFCEIAFDHVGRNWGDHVRIDNRLIRRVDSRYTRADITKAKRTLGWTPSVSFEELVRMMVDANLARLRRSADEGTTGAAAMAASKQDVRAKGSTG
jgi:GDPmannose 4,6-dehydratase